MEINVKFIDVDIKISQIIIYVKIKHKTLFI